MKEEMKAVKIGLFLVLLTLLFGIGMGIYFGVAEDSVKSYISDGVIANPAVHDAKSNSKIWRYAQRSHFHATGISAFSLGLVVLIALSSMKRNLKTIAAILVGLGGFYPLAWFTMFLLAPSIGRDPAHEHIITEVFTHIGVGGLLLGLFMLCASLFLGMFNED